RRTTNATSARSIGDVRKKIESRRNDGRRAAAKTTMVGARKVRKADWRRNEEYERRRWQEMRGRERGQGERGGWEGGRGRQWENEGYDYGRERNYGMQGRNWPSRGEWNRGWEGGQQNWGMGRPGWQGGGEWQGRGWERDIENDQPYGGDFGGDCDER